MNGFLNREKIMNWFLKKYSAIISKWRFLTKFGGGSIQRYLNTRRCQQICNIEKIFCEIILVDKMRNSVVMLILSYFLYEVGVGIGIGGVLGSNSQESKSSSSSSSFNGDRFRDSSKDSSGDGELWQETNSLFDRLRPPSSPSLMGSIKSGGGGEENGAGPSLSQNSDVAWKPLNLGETLNGLFQNVLNRIVEDILPALGAVSRRRRKKRSNGNSSEDSGHDSDYVESFAAGVGALIGRQNCRERLTCKAGKVVQHNIPGAQVLVMLAENLIPDPWQNWFSTVKTSVIDRRDNCDFEYKCQILYKEKDDES